MKNAPFGMASYQPMQTNFGRQGLLDPRALGNLSFWFQSADPTTLYTTTGMSTRAVANNDPVGRWLDKSGNNNDIDQASVSAPDLRPTLLTAQQNGYPGVYINFDASTGVANQRQNMNFVKSPVCAAPFTVYLVQNYTHVGGVNQTFLTDNSSVSTIRYNSDDKPHLVKGGVADFANGGTAVTSAGAASITVWEYDGATAFFSINGVASIVSKSSDQTFPNSWSIFGSDQQAVFNSTMKSVMFEVLYYQAQHTASQRAQVYHYLNNFWNLGFNL